MNDNDYEVVVIGGGAAGLSAAVTLGRSRRRTLVIDAGRPRNARADGVHGFLTRDGMNPLEVVRVGREEVRSYGGEIREAQVTDAVRTDDGFTVTTDDGTVNATQLVIATGLTDVLPDIPGLRERFGRDVIHCPYCHGYEVRDQAIGVIATSAGAHHQALLFRQLSDDVAVLLHTATDLTADLRDDLGARGIKLISGEITSVAVEDDRLTGVHLDGGELVRRDALVVGPRFVVNVAGLERLGLEVVEHPMGVGEQITADERGQTNVPGVWVAGNASNIMAQVVTAADTGMRVGAQVNADMIMSAAG
jgi:thioredoxin reductase